MSSSLLQEVDARLEALFAGWNVYTTLICLILGAYLVYPLFFYTDPDTHPMLLARQSSNSFVRQPGESAIYRSLEVPHGYPLRSGLKVKDQGEPRWSSGRDGDMRDIWMQALKGPRDAEGKSIEKPGRVISVNGKDEVIEHSLSDLTQDVNSLGQYLGAHTGQRIALYLPNSVELITSIFATTIYGITPVLVPFNKPLQVVANTVKDASAHCMIASAGSLPLERLLQLYPGLKHVIWVAERSSRHMEWNEVPEGVGGRAEIAVWHEVVEEKRNSAMAELPDRNPDAVTPSIITTSISAHDPEKHELTEFTQENLVAAVAAQMSALPHSQRLGPSDLLLPLVPLTDQYSLTLVLAAFFSNSSIALTSVSGAKVNYAAAFRGVDPTVVVASTQTLSKLHSERAATPGSLAQQVTHWRRARSLAAGSMPKVAGVSPRPRLIYTFERPMSGITPLTSKQVSDLRIFTGAYIIHAFTVPTVAGAISQTNMLDYRMANESHATAATHYGPPLSSVEIKLVDTAGHKNTDDHCPEGQLIVNGPAVAGGTAVVENIMKITEDNTLSYAQ